MSSLDEIRSARLNKLNTLKDKGVNPYPKTVKRDFELDELSHNFSKISKSKKSVSVVGRIMSIRGQGAIVFFDLNDGTAKFQGLCKKDGKLSGESFELFKNTADIGDFIEVKGKLFLTKKKEKTIEVEEWKMIAKSLRPLPEKWHGLQDVEERFRKRYLDLLSSPEVKERFIIRSKIISEIRNILDSDGFLEVETPVLQPIYGGASAEPFTTHHRALNVDLYLRIAPELYLKRLLVGGMPKVYEIARNFRNEGIDMTHNPEFTMLEYYRSYSDSDEEMKFVEKMIKTLAKKVLGKSSLDFEGNKIDFSKKFSRISFYDLLKRYAQIPDPENATFEDISLQAQRLGIKVEKGDSREKIMDNIYKKTCRPKIIQPTFIVDYPTNYFPLAKKMESNENIADVFQLVVSGVELVKAFSELNDPIDQLNRLKEQEEYKKAGDKEAQVMDTDFIESMEYGMPPSGGVGIGIDRLVMLLTGTRNIREVILFPTLRPKN